MDDFVATYRPVDPRSEDGKIHVAKLTPNFPRVYLHPSVFDRQPALVSIVLHIETYLSEVVRAV